jgi:hypothetical protein
MSNTEQNSEFTYCAGLTSCDDYVIYVNNYDHHIIMDASDIKIWIRRASFKSGFCKVSIHIQISR